MLEENFSLIFMENLRIVGILVMVYDIGNLVLQIMVKGQIY